MTMHDYFLELHNIKDQKEELERQLKEVNEKESYLEEIIISKMRSEGLEKASTQWGSASIKSDTYVSISDFERFMNWCIENKRFELLVKEIKRKVWDEKFHSQGIEVPGTKQFEKDTITFRRRDGEE